ncbi:TetR/AcrR family transcriptional regulator C-terminal domain-containing protein [Actinoplanes auranticolor]|nr:TetR/AcrR family transcriptional regulator C-terminal domain-containing protein [Actinoplanes auranticolor]
MRAVIFGYFGTLTDPGAEEYREPLAHRTGGLLGGCRPRFWEALAGSFGERSASLYGYVSSKDEMYDLMVDWVDGEDGPPPAPSGNLRSDLFGLAHRIRRSILRHPWMTSVAAGRPNFGPNSLAWHEYGLAVMDDRGLTIGEMLVANEILQSFVRGFTTRELAEQQALQRAGLDADAWGRAMRPYTEAIEKSGRYPRFTRVVRDPHLPPAPDRHELAKRLPLNVGGGRCMRAPAGGRAVLHPPAGLEPRSVGHHPCVVDARRMGRVPPVGQAAAVAAGAAFAAHERFHRASVCPAAPRSRWAPGAPGYRPVADLDQEVSSADQDLFAVGAGRPGRWCRPGQHLAAFGLRQRPDPGRGVEFQVRAGADHHHRASVGEAAGLGPVLSARPETGSGVVMACESAGHDDDH